MILQLLWSKLLNLSNKHSDTKLKETTAYCPVQVSWSGQLHQLMSLHHVSLQTLTESIMSACRGCGVKWWQAEWRRRWGLFADSWYGWLDPAVMQERHQSSLGRIPLNRRRQGPNPDTSWLLKMPTNGAYWCSRAQAAQCRPSVFLRLSTRLWITSSRHYHAFSLRDEGNTGVSLD